MERSLLHDIFELMVPNVYFQPPNGLKMEYPCIVYKWDDEQVLFADNGPYRRKKRYQVTVIDRDPDSILPDMVAGLPYSSFDRAYPADNLNHTVYNLFF